MIMAGRMFKQIHVVQVVGVVIVRSYDKQGGPYKYPSEEETILSAEFSVSHNFTYFWAWLKKFSFL